MIKGISETADVEGINLAAACVDGTPTDYPMKFQVGKQAGTTWSPFTGSQMGWAWYNNTQLRATLDCGGNMTLSSSGTFAALNYHQLSLYHSNPSICLTDVGVNLNVTSAATAQDTNAIWLDCDDVTPAIGISGDDANAFEITITDGADQASFTGATAGYTFDAQLHGNIEYDKINVGLDDAHAMASDTLWFFENDFQTAMTLDSIRVRATTDDQDVNVIKSARNGGSIAVVDAITASTDGFGEVYYQTETTLTTSSIAAGEYIGITKPTTESDNIAISIYYHVTKQKR